MKPPVQQQLLAVMEKIDRPGTFCTSGRLPAIFPGLSVAGIGNIALPLDKRQAAALKKQSHQAPYGKGTQTLVDTEVRRVWEIDAEQIELLNPDWSNALLLAVEAIQSSLGLEDQKLEAHLYKLLLYETGSFFLAHRDGEKLDRMVATLVIALPSIHEGGELVVRHDGQEEAVDFAPQSGFQTQYAAFYADCEHEVRPVTSGFRLALVYNLTLVRSRKSITPPSVGEHVATATQLLNKWREERRIARNEDEVPVASKLAVLLDHQYTEASLTRDVLKGLDRTRADVLFAAAREAGYDAFLAIVTLWQSGSADPIEGSGGGWYHDYDDDYEEDNAGDYVLGEAFDDSLTVKHFSDAEGNSLAFGEMDLDEAEIVSRQPLHDSDPDREEFEGFTGNAGMTMEYWYHRAAIILWPSESRFDVLFNSGIENAVGGLEQMIRLWKHASQNEQEGCRRSCLEFARHIVERWPEQKFASGFNALSDQVDDEFDEDEEGDDRDLDEASVDDGSVDLFEDDDDGEDSRFSRRPHLLLSLLDELDEISLISDWISNVLAKDVWVDPGDELGDLCEQLGWSTFQDELLKLFDSTTTETLQRNALLLADWSSRKDSNRERQNLCTQLAKKMMSVIERWEPRVSRRIWATREVRPKEILPPLVQTFLLLDLPQLMERLVRYVLDRPKYFKLMTVQVPVLLNLKIWFKRNVKHSFAALDHWLSSVFEQLEARASDTPKEPSDWQRKGDTGCSCEDCKVLSQFLQNPNESVIRMPLAEQRRKHLHRVIDRKKLDTTHITSRYGRPFTLVCTKTKASYERAMKSHRSDLNHLARFQLVLDWHNGLRRGSKRPDKKAAKPKARRRK